VVEALAPNTLVQFLSLPHHSTSLHNTLSNCLRFLQLQSNFHQSADVAGTVESLIWLSGRAAWDFLLSLLLTIPCACFLAAAIFPLWAVYLSLQFLISVLIFAFCFSLFPDCCGSLIRYPVYSCVKYYAILVISFITVIRYHHHRHRLNSKSYCMDHCSGGEIMTRKRKCLSKSWHFRSSGGTCLQSVVEHRQRRGRRNIAWQAIPHPCCSNRKSTTSDSWLTTVDRSEHQAIQWRLMSASVMWSQRLGLKMSFPVAFWTDWRRWMWVTGKSTVVIICAKRFHYIAC